MTIPGFYIKVVCIITLSSNLWTFGETDESNDGICTKTWTVRESSWEPYTYSYKAYERDTCGWYYCQKEKIRFRTDTRLVYKDVKHSKRDCCEGYLQNILADSCDAICEPSCENGHCDSPGNCTCYHGYIHVTSHSCGPICQPECVHGRCTAPGQCTCIDGYTKLEYSSYHCTPHCNSSCTNGKCIAPDMCVCNEGYIKDSEGTCEPVCGICVHGKCTEPGECTCWKGYVFINPHVCEPYCSLECLHGDCTLPETCICHNGYHLLLGSSNICTPDCCANAHCTEPFNCTCFINYTLTEDNNCEPVCNQCINGNCTSPNVCECYDGYKMNYENVCIPECSNCQNGNCTEPEVCQCFEGYEVDFVQSCVPKCEGGCVNGFCSEPGNCTCLSEHEQIEANLCLPVCGTQITNGSLKDCINFQKYQLSTKTLIDNIFDTLLMVRIKANCSYLYENLNSSFCSYNQCQSNDCKGMSVTCNVVNNPISNNKLICYFNNTDESLYETHLNDITIYENVTNAIRIKERNNINMTLLLPEILSEESGGCDLCLCGAQRSNETHQFILQFSSCLASHYEFQSKTQGSLLQWSIGFILTLLLATLAFLLTKTYWKNNYRKDYSVAYYEGLRNENGEEEVRSAMDEVDLSCTGTSSVE